MAARAAAAIQAQKLAALNAAFEAAFLRLHDAVAGQVAIGGTRTITQMMAFYNKIYASDDPVVDAVMQKYAREAFTAVSLGNFQRESQLVAQGKAVLRAKANAVNTYVMNDTHGGGGIAAQRQLELADAIAAATPPKQSNLGFAGEIVRGVWTAAGGALLQGSPYGAYQATKLLVTEPGEFFGQYVDAWDTAVDVAEAWWDTAGSTIDVLQGDKSLSDHISDATHSSLLAHIGTSWDERDGDALGSTWFNFLGLVAGAKAAKPSIKPTPVTPKPVVPEVVVPVADAATPTITPIGASTVPGAGTPALVYRGGSRSPTNLTPRPGIDEGGLSTFSRPELAAPAGGKVQVIDTSRLVCTTACPDAPPVGHVSITPRDGSSIADWAATRDTGEVSPFTQDIIDAIIDEIRMAKQ